MLNCTNKSPSTSHTCTLEAVCATWSLPNRISLFFRCYVGKRSEPGNVTCKPFNYCCRLYTGSCEEYIKRTVAQTGHYLVLKVTHTVNVATDTHRGNSLLLRTYRNILQQAKGTVKCTLVQALRLCTGRTAHRGSRLTALLFLDHGTRRG